LKNIFSANKPETIEPIGTNINETNIQEVKN